MARRICAYCGEDIPGYPHVTLWDERQGESYGVRFHTMEEAALWLLRRLDWKVPEEAEGS